MIKRYISSKNIIETLKYVATGILISSINFILFYLLLKFSLGYLASNVISYLIATLLFFIINKYYIFKNISAGIYIIFKEFCLFIIMRITTLILDSILLTLFIEFFLLPIMLSKIIASVLVIGLNFILSKFIIFKNK
ncbi:GtrA family protein [Paenibacillus sp. GYB003]|uniref:GtrA family protein n=1 Tax=Paenibacillus sp. GYB003 TaxID=2994392 RepID=UPI003FA6F9D6